jgi:branched-chain amino acid transport system permease protein
MKKDALIAVVLFGLVALVPLAGEAYWLRLGTIMLMYGVISMSWNFIGGMAGYPSFAVAAFFGLGAYTGAVLQKFGLPVGLAWGGAGLAALAFAALLGVALLRLRGHYFAIASLVVAEVLRELVNSATELTGGGMGLNLPVPAMSSVDAQAAYFFYAMLALAAITFAAMLVTTYSKLGFGLRCIQQNESAADMLGVNTTLYKVAAFMLSGVFVGVAGAVYASWVHYIEPPDVFDVLYSVKPIVMALLGGLGSTTGAVLGAFLFLGIEETVWRNSLQIHSGLLGLLVVVLLLFLPHGIVSLAPLAKRLGVRRA